MCLNPLCGGTAPVHATEHCLPSSMAHAISKSPAAVLGSPYMGLSVVHMKMRRRTDIALSTHSSVVHSIMHLFQNSMQTTFICDSLLNVLINCTMVSCTQPANALLQCSRR